MKTQMLIALTLAVALTALVLATWPVVADAPWEQEAAVVENNDALLCQGALDYRVAVFASPPTRISVFRVSGSILSGTSDYGPVVTDQTFLEELLDGAQREISAYC